MRIVSNQSNPSYKIAWIVLILSILLGLLFYIMGRGRNPNNTKRRIAQLSTMTVPLYKRFKDVEESILKEYPSQSRVTKFLLESGFPVYNNTETVYFSEGDKFYEAMLEEVKKAEKFIFLEFYNLKRTHVGHSFEVLKEKVSKGVEVRLVYDDFGCISTLPKKYYLELRKHGIKAVVFNPIKPLINNFT